MFCFDSWNKHRKLTGLEYFAQRHAAWGTMEPALELDGSLFIFNTYRNDQKCSGQFANIWWRLENENPVIAIFYTGRIDNISHPGIRSGFPASTGIQFYEYTIN